MPFQDFQPESFKTKKMLFSVLYGLIAGIIVSVGLIAIFTFFIAYKNVSENLVPSLTMLSSGIGALSAGIVCGMLQMKNGLVCGLIAGIALFFLRLVAGFIISESVAMDMYTLFALLISIISCVLGGIIGVNIKFNPFRSSNRHFKEYT